MAQNPVNEVTHIDPTPMAYETPSQLPSSSPLVPSHPSSNLNSVHVMSPMFLIGASGVTPSASVSSASPTAVAAATAAAAPLTTTTTTATKMVVVAGSGGVQSVRRAAFMTPAPSPVSPIAAVVDGAWRANGGKSSARGSITPTLLFENFVSIGGPPFTTALSPSISQNSRVNGSVGNISPFHSLSSNDDLALLDVQLSSQSPPCLLAAGPLCVTAISPTRGAPVRGVAAKEVGCIVLDPGNTTDCAICLCDRDDLNSVPEDAAQRVPSAQSPQEDAKMRVSLPVESVKLSCSHEFHADCLQRWLLTGRVCPICRREVVPSAGK